MIKRIVIYIATVVLLFLIGYFSHKYYIKNHNMVTSISILSTYVFNAIACLLIYISVEITFKFLPNETGYLYLALTIVKVGVFVLIFQKSIFPDTPLSKSEKFMFAIPFFIFLILETIGIAKLLNNSNFKTKNLS